MSTQERRHKVEQMTCSVFPLGAQTRRERSGKDFNPNADLLHLQQDIASTSTRGYPRGFLLQTILSVLLCRVHWAEGLAARPLAPGSLSALCHSVL